MRAVNKGYVQMREVRVNKEELLSKIKENKDKHVEEYRQASKGYKEDALKAIRKEMAKLEKRIKDLEEGEVIELASIVFNLPVPQNHEKDYDQVISMLSMHLDNEITIKSDEFACFVMDDWDWMPHTKMINRSYIK